ncbi:MAG: thiamine diphosphokinase [Desulforhopalus sp.]|nr:thiamine diphosphokinase [Desulforhopalus sp.]
MLTIIFANGAPADPPNLAGLLATATLIIAADGGSNTCERLGILPNVLIGDLDSTATAIVEKYLQKQVAIHRHPPRKDATDLELALDFALLQGARQVVLIGGLGGRWDMSLANILLCAAEKYHSMHISVAETDCTMHLLHPGKPFTLRGLPGERVSLLPLQGGITGLTLQGFDYPLQAASLSFGTTWGVSNVLHHQEATIEFTGGLLLCVHLFATSEKAEVSAS